MASHGAAKKVAAVESKQPKLMEGMEHLHALHAQMATHLAGLQQMHESLGAHLGIKMPGKAEGKDAAEPDGVEE